MAEATITSKGQVTIPKSVRDRLEIEPGDRIEFASTEQGYLILPVRRDLRVLRGMFKGRRAKPATIAEMKAVIGAMGSDD